MLLCHPFAISELALGSLSDRVTVLAFLAVQRQAATATHDEIMIMIERHRLFSMGIGYTDAHPLASVLLDRGAALWPRDKRLRNGKALVDGSDRQGSAAADQNSARADPESVFACAFAITSLLMLPPHQDPARAPQVTADPDHQFLEAIYRQYPGDLRTCPRSIR